MNKKQNLLAIALSASFVLAGANVAEANDQVSTQVEDVVLKETDAISNKEIDQTNENNNEPLNSEDTIAKSDEEKANANASEEEAPAKSDKKEADAEAGKNLPTDKVVEPEGPVEDNLQVGPEAKPVSQGAEAPQPDSNQGKDAQKAPEQKADDPNYGEDEGKIKDYDGSERYKETDLQPGDTNQESNITDQGEAKDGLEFNTKNPSADSPSKTEYGYQITIDKKTGQRTYTKVYVTDSGLIPLDKGNKPMMGKGEKLTPESPDVTYKPGENAIIDGAGKQRNLNYDASEETLKHINNKDNDFTSLGFKDNYTADNPRVKFFGGSFTLGYKVNPWPNENDKLEQLKLNGQYNEKVFVQGQDIDTGIKVDNIDDNAKERLVGQVYNPITGKIVPGASAYIADDGNIHIKMPEGALKKDKDGKTVINEDSIFNTPDYKALQNLDVKFFARPRTAEEFTKIAETEDDYGQTGTYTGSEAGTADINHKGTNVKIDKQGIDRYDHYNLIGGFKLNLDDTRYYDQKFEDGNGDDTSKVTSSAVKPGEPFKVGMVEPENPKETDKSAAEMNAAEGRGEASGKLIMDFIEKENKGKAPEDQWKVELDKGDIANFTITPPKSAKAGDFIAIPIEYTYTNGSKDVHWFHFVVQESTYIKPEYDAQVNFPVNEQTSPATVTEDGKRIPPSRFTLPDTLKTDEDGNKIVKDDKGNDWTVKVDETSGKVTAKPVNPQDFDGGEKLTVPVIAHYVDEQKPNEDITEEVNAYFVIEEKANMTPRYNAKAGKVGDKLSSDVILNTEDRYNRRPGKYTLDSPTYTDDKGNTWNVSINENTGVVTATVPNAEEGKSIDGALLNVPVTAHYYEEDAEGNKVEAGTKTTEVQFVAYGTNGKVEKTVEVPFETKVEKDPKLKKGEIKVITEGKVGSKKVTYTIEDSKITKEEEQEIEKPQERLIHVGEGVNDGTHKIEEKVEVGFETEIQFDDSLAPGETKEIQKGEAGEKKRDITLTIEDGKVTKTEEGEFTETKAPKKRIIKVGRNTEGKVEHKEELPFKYKVEEVDTLKKGEYKIVKPGKVETKTTTWTIKNSKGEGEPTVTEDPAEDALIQVGKGTNDGTHEIVEKKELPFETRYEYDDSLEPGEEKVETPGSPGEQERTNTLVIKDGKVVETKEGEFKTTKEPQERLIKIGRKSTEGETTETHTNKIPFDTKVIYDENLEAGSQIIEKEGKVGEEEVTTTQKIKDSNPVGEPEVSKKTIVEKEDRVVRVGIKPVIKETELGNNTEYRHNPELKEGETKVIEEGSKGSVKYTTTFNKKTGKLEVKEERTEPKNKVVEYGSKTEGEFTYESEQAYDIIVRENPNLEAGKTNVIQEGKPGKTETTVKIKNSEEVSRETKTITEKQDKIIEIGTKNVCEIPPVDPEDPEKPGKEDPEKPGKEDPEKPGKENPEKPGKENPEKPGKEDPTKPGEDKPNEPGKDKPNEPGTPGNKPNEPSKPNEPGTPGEKPNEPGKPGTPGKTPSVPGTPGKENPKTPESPKENSTKEESTREEKNNSDHDMLSRKRKDSHELSKKDKSTNPKTGVGSVAPILTSMGISIAGLLATRKKKEDE